MIIKNLTVTEHTVLGYSSNCYLLISGNEAAVVDPSLPLRDILSAIEAEGVKLKCILLTHGHFDHIHTLDELRDATGARVYVHQSDAECLGDPKSSMFTYFGFPEKVYKPADVLLKDGSAITLGDEEIITVHTPGHTPGGVCFLIGDDMLTGDSLFDMSVGRTDFPRSDYDELRRSISMLYRAYPQVTIYPGHKGSSTMARQIEANPFTRGLADVK